MTLFRLFVLALLLGQRLPYTQQIPHSLLVQKKLETYGNGGISVLEELNASSNLVPQHRVVKDDYAIETS